MDDAITAMVAAAGIALLLLGTAAQLRTHRLRRRWAELGMGLQERATGLASLAAIPVHFPTDLGTAQATGSQLAVIVLRRLTIHPEQFGRALAAATRIHETGWRLDFDLFAVTAHVAGRDEAVLAAARLGRDACGGDVRQDVRVGIALCPDDADDLLNAVDVALRRMRSLPVVSAVAVQIRAADGVTAHDATSSPAP